MNDFKLTIEKLKKMEGKVRGSCSESMIEYLKNIGKEDYLPKIEAKLKEYGFEEKIRKIDPLRWYPIAFEVALIFSIYEILDWKKEQLKELGRNIPKISFIVRLLMKYFVSTERSYRAARVYWKKHFDSGEFQSVELNKKGKYILVRIKNFDLHPLYCIFLEGYLETMTNFIIKSKKIWTTETKCTFKDDPYHEYLMKWE